MEKNQEVEKIELPVEGFVRSPYNPGAIINTDNKALQSYKITREAHRRKIGEINSLKEEVDQLKGLVHQLLEKIK